MTLQKELSSSPQAVASTLRSMVADQAHGNRTRAELQHFLHLAESIPVGRKLTAVREILERFDGKFLIFTEYRATLHTIVEQLNAWGIPTVGFHGGLSIEQKEAAVAAFRGADGSATSGNEIYSRTTNSIGSSNGSNRNGGKVHPPDPQLSEIRVMVSTESGAEGRNLQFCSKLINYDLPWNPMRVEQRIGRLHRLGQTEDVTIFNLSCNETIESHVIDLLARKIRMFELVIGELDLILGNVNGAKSFEELLREAWEASASQDDLADRIEAIGDVLIRARRDYERVRESNIILDETLEPS